jgi:hypothetical protein
MNRLLAANVFLLGLVAGLLVNSNGCTGPAGGSAHAADGCSCTIEGPIDVNLIASPQEPVPVMICDGQEDRGICAEVYESYEGAHVLSAG